MISKLLVLWALISNKRESAHRLSPDGLPLKLVLLRVDHGDRSIDAGTLPVVAGGVRELDVDVVRRSRVRGDVAEADLTVAVDGGGVRDGLPPAVEAVGAGDAVGQVVPDLLGVLRQQIRVAVNAVDVDRGTDGDGAGERGARVADRERSVALTVDAGCDVVDGQRRRIDGNPVDEDPERGDVGLDLKGLLCGQIGAGNSDTCQHESRADEDGDDLGLLGGEQLGGHLIVSQFLRFYPHRGWIGSSCFPERFWVCFSLA